jgi:hypothetical protein
MEETKETCFRVETKLVDNTDVFEEILYEHSDSISQISANKLLPDSFLSASWDQK